MSLPPCGVCRSTVPLVYSINYKSKKNKLQTQQQKRERNRKGVFLRFWACSACSASLAGSRLGLCQHGRRRRQSDECGSAKHGRQRYLCKDCGGKGICRCRHERRRSACKECGGGSSAASTVGAAGAVSARSAARWQQHLRAQEAAQRLQGVRRQQHLQARAAAHNPHEVVVVRHFKPRSKEVMRNSLG